MLSDLRFRLRALFRRKAVEEQLNDELRFHLEREVEKLVSAGQDPAEARRAARLAFGGLDAIQEECREARGLAALESVVQDLRYSMRSLRRIPAFTVAAILTLALGIGAISTVFTLTYTFLFLELPVDRPEELVVVQPTRRQGRAPGWVSYPDYVHFRDGARTVRSLAAHYSTAPLYVSAGGEAGEINGAVVSANFFPVLGLKPELGRFFSQSEDRTPDRDFVAVVSYDLWRTRFQASPDLLGQEIRINGVPFTVIGVAPQTFHGVTIAPAQIYIPTMMLRVGYRWCEDSLSRECTLLSMIGRLEEGRTVEEARAEMFTRLPAHWANAPEGENTGVTVTPARGVHHPDAMRSSMIRFVRLLAWVAGVLLLVCCANLAGLLIARNTARTREFAIRASLGAGRARLARQLITETMVLATMGGAAGVLMSLALTALLNSMFYSVDVQGRPLYYDFSPQVPVILGVLGVSIVAGLLAGILPAWKSIRSGLAESLKQQSSAVSSGLRMGRWLVALQAAVAVALVAVAGLLASSARAVVAGNDYEWSQVALMRLRPRLLRYPPEKAQQFLRRAIGRLEAVPGVESVSMVGTGVALLGFATEVALPSWEESRSLETGYIEVGPRYFETLRTPVLRGREFRDGDTAGSPPVAVVNETLGRRLWPGGNILGATLLVNRRPHEVIGVVQDVSIQNRDAPPEPYVYVPFWQNATQTDARLCLRVQGDPAALFPVLVREVNRVDPDVPVTETLTLAAQVTGALRTLHISATFVSYAAAMALPLSAIGLYGALAFSVSRRTKEIGIRMAVGAEPGQVQAMVVREGLFIMLAGVAAGLAAAVAAGGLVRHLLYGSGAMDVWLYSGAVFIVAGAGITACWIPARRAASVDPLVALRDE